MGSGQGQRVSLFHVERQKKKASEGEPELFFRETMPELKQLWLCISPEILSGRMGLPFSFTDGGWMW